MNAVEPLTRQPSAAATAPAARLRFLFVGGGTGGHLAPALGLAEALEERGHETLFLTSGRAVERWFLGEERAVRSLRVEGGRWPWYLGYARGALAARAGAAAFDPHLVVSLGGRIGALALAARRGRPLVVLEGNRVVGKSVRWLQRWSTATLTLFPDTVGELRNGRWVGPIGRRALVRLPQAEARRRLGLAASEPVLLVVGGSQGAADLNQFTAALLPRLAGAGYQLLALTGAGKAEPLRAACILHKLPALVLENSSDMGLMYSAADLALSRGGAATIAELWLFHLPAAIVPYPHHKDRQQEHNARALGPGALLLPRLDRADAETLLATLRQPQRLRAMAEHLQRSAPPDGRHGAADFLERTAHTQV